MHLIRLTRGYAKAYGPCCFADPASPGTQGTAWEAVTESATRWRLLLFGPAIG